MNAAPTIIVVEDDEGLNHLIQRTLRREGFRTEGVLNGAEAVAKVADNRNSILLLDYDISDMNGKQLVETLIDKKFDVPFIIVTGRGNEQIAVEMMKLGAMDYIVKGNDFIDIFPHLIKRVVKELDYKNLLKKSEEDLRKSEERYRRLTEAITDYIYTVCVGAGRTMETTHSEACFAVTGYTGREFALNPDLWIRMVVKEDRDIVRQQAEQVLSGHFPQPIEHRIIRKDGVVRWVESTVVPNHDADGNLISYDGMIRDITDRKRLEKALLEIEEREQRRIGQDIHDDLGQLLTGIAFKTQVLERKIEKNLHIDSGDAAEITALINQAKDQARLLSRGLLSLEAEEDSLMVALKDLAANTKRIFHVVCDFKCEDVVSIYNKAAVTHLYRIAQEAVTNAVRHGNPSDIEICLLRKHDEVELKIRDNGSGISEMSGRTTGMGLQIMKYRANMIGASFDIHSETGKGTLAVCIFTDKIREKD